MKEDQISRTAQMTAFNRGYHSRHDSSLIFDDFLAFDLLGGEGERSVKDQMLAGLRAFNPLAAESFCDDDAALSWLMQAGAATPIVLGRARYAEELLEKAVELGVHQYVLLGAGLDTFAFRRPDLLAKIRVFELDHQGTQGYKLQRLEKLGWEIPGNLRFVPLDFTRSSLIDALHDAGFDSQVPSFFSWLGVTYYLTRNEVMGTLHNIVRIAAPGSSIVFDYLDPWAYDPLLSSPRVRRMIEAVSELGEPMLSAFEPGALGNELAQSGLKLVENLCPHDIHLRYFIGRSDHYRACEHVHFACAEIIG